MILFTADFYLCMKWKKTCVRNEMCTQFQPMRFNVGSDGILLMAQSDITSFS